MTDNNHAAAAASTDEEDDLWHDASACVARVRKTAEYQMAGGGSHWWSYVVFWKSEDDDQPEVYVRSSAGLERKEGTLIVRSDGSGCQDFRLVPLDFVLPEDTEEHSYIAFLCPPLSE